MATNIKRRKELSRLLPEGGILTRTWLLDHGFSRHAIDNLVKSDQLIALSSGVYSKWDSHPTWQGLVYFLQQNLSVNVTVGGLTALELQGFSHYLPLSGGKKIHLYGTARLPSWLGKLAPDLHFEWHNEWKLLGEKTMSLTNQPDPLKQYTNLQSWKEGKSELVISSPERALLELLLDVPNKVPFDHANQLIQGMTSLSPHSLQALLEKCQNIKVRRLFFWLADRHQHTWLGKLQPEKIGMGSGKRALSKSGKLDNKYNITVPKSL